MVILISHHIQRALRFFPSILGIIFAATTLPYGMVAAQGLPSSCGNLANHYGPFDYRVNRGYTLSVVEDAHFTPLIENLIRGKTSSIGADLAYTLRTFPNHHRALIAAERWADRAGTQRPVDMQYTIECYYLRALTFKPDDTVVRLLFARYLHKLSRTADGIAQLQIVLNQQGVSALSIYNTGLVALELKDFETAATAAVRAKNMGIENRHLLDQLSALGKVPSPSDIASSPPP